MGSLSAQSGEELAEVEELAAVEELAPVEQLASVEQLDFKDEKNVVRNHLLAVSI
jgi:hypothetical protein